MRRSAGVKSTLSGCARVNGEPLGSPRPSQSKREKERARQGRNQLKNERRAQRRVDRADKPVVADGEDPDIAGIVPGPQPRLDEESDVPRSGS